LKVIKAIIIISVHGTHMRFGSRVLARSEVQANFVVKDLDNR